MLKKILGLGFALLLGTSSASQAALLNFDDGIEFNSVGSFYSGLGVTFSNTQWIGNFGLAGSSGPYGIIATDNGGVSPNGFQWTNFAPVVAIFTSAVSSVGVRGIDVGGNGLRIDAYDAMVGGSLVGSDTVFGTGTGAGEFYDILATAGSIFRVEIYQLAAADGDGVILDDFSFTAGAVPEPETYAMMLAGLGLLGLAARRRKQKAA